MENSREICDPIAYIYWSALAYIAKELEAYRNGSFQQI
jgi:hypothetical protein